MRKFSFYILNSLLVLFISIAGIFSYNVLPAMAEVRSVYIGGQTAGFLLDMGGAQVLAINEINTDEGALSPAKDAGIQCGDIIVGVNNQTVTNAEELNEKLDQCQGKKVSLQIKRSGQQKDLSVLPQRDAESGKYKIGVLIRDTLSGIGTITYIDKENGRFGALGHAVCDENNAPLSVSNGKVYGCSIVSVTKGIRGKAGELKGLFTGDRSIGVADKVNGCGLYGEIDDKIDFKNYQKAEIATLSQVKMGEAYIYSTINGESVERFSISIVKVDEGNRENKNFVIKVTDENLITKTGGIVQGMSGSPIVQDGKLVGAVTHVFLNDPTRGYGIGIKKMLGN